MLTPLAQPSCVTRMNSVYGPWNQVAIITPSGCHTVANRSQSPASRHTAQRSIIWRISSSCCKVSVILFISGRG